MNMLIFCLGIGILHIFSGISMKMANLIKEGKVFAAIVDHLTWMLLIVGLVLFAVPGASNIGMILAGVSAGTILLTAGRSSKGLKKITGGLLGLYGITNYMSDIISYSRIMALGLATGVIGMVMNMLAGMVIGAGIIGIVFAVVIYAIGHIFNIAMGLLSAYVHAGRLQYLEFFDKFYEGGGREFTPLSISTKSVDIVDDESQAS